MESLRYGGVTVQTIRLDKPGRATLPAGGTINLDKPDFGLDVPGQRIEAAAVAASGCLS